MTFIDGTGLTLLENHSAPGTWQRAGYPAFKQPSPFSCFDCARFVPGESVQSRAAVPCDNFAGAIGCPLPRSRVCRTTNRATWQIRQACLRRFQKSGSGG